MLNSSVRVGVWHILSVVLSVVFILAGPQKSTAHELLPTIADISFDNGEVTIDFRVNLEAFLAGVDLDAVANTDEDEASAAYDALRRMSAEEIEARAGEIIATWNAYPLIVADDPVRLEIQSLMIPRDLDFELPRISEMRLTGEVPDRADSMIINWPAGSGALVLREQGVDEPYTGYLDGGTSSPAIDLSGDVATSRWQAFSSYISSWFR